MKHKYITQLYGITYYFLMDDPIDEDRAWSMCRFGEQVTLKYCSDRNTVPAPVGKEIVTVPFDAIKDWKEAEYVERERPFEQLKLF